MVELAQKSEESNQLYQSLKALNEKLQTHENEKVDFLKQVRLWNFLKSYLHYKMITSQNMLSEAQIKHFCYIIEKLFSVLKMFKFLYF